MLFSLLGWPCLSPSRDQLQQLTCLISCCQPPLCKRQSLGIRQGLHVTRQGWACLLGHALLCPKRPAAGGIQLTTFCCLPGSRERSSPLPQRPELTGEREAVPKPPGAAASLTPRPSITAMLGCGCGGALPLKQQMPHRSSKPRGLFQTLPGPSPAAVRRVVPSCELSCFVQAGDRSQAAQPSNAAT